MSNRWTIGNDELSDWRHNLRENPGTSFPREMQIALIDETLRLREINRRLERQLLQATQLSLLPEPVAKARP